MVTPATVDRGPAQSRLPRSFYARGVERVATDLVGCYLAVRRRGSLIGGRIVETEAYAGPGDPGSHADRAPNGRARIMFGPPGHAYVYFTYGMHHCLNVVTNVEGSAGAVLIRALEPLWGTRHMRVGAPASLRERHLASGPGRLCRALGIDRRLNGGDLLSGPIVIAAGQAPDEIDRGPRIGLSIDDGRAWRFWADSPSVSVRSRSVGTRS